MNLMNKTDFARELFNLYGPVTRARDCFLYTKKGVRITDMYQEDGRAILGWQGGSAFTHLKNVLSRGQTGSFICEESSRLQRAISQLLASDRKIFFFSDKVCAMKAAIKISQKGTSIYIPWTVPQKINSEIDCMVIAPPLPWTDTIFILAVKANLIEENSQLQGQVYLPFAMQTAITRATYNLIQAIQERSEKDWFIYDQVLTKYFERNGPYLCCKVPEKKYDDFVRFCLKLGIAINPDYNKHSIVPFGADKGVFTSLKNSPFAY